MIAAAAIVYAILAASWGRHIFYYVMCFPPRPWTCWVWFAAQVVFWPISMVYWAFFP